MKQNLEDPILIFFGENSGRSPHNSAGQSLLCSSVAVGKANHEKPAERNHPPNNLEVGAPKSPIPIHIHKCSVHTLSIRMATGPTLKMIKKNIYTCGAIGRTVLECPASLLFEPKPNLPSSSIFFFLDHLSCLLKLLGKLTAL